MSSYNPGSCSMSNKQLYEEKDFPKLNKAFDLSPSLSNRVMFPIFQVFCLFVFLFLP